MEILCRCSMSSEREDQTKTQGPSKASTALYRHHPNFPDGQNGRVRLVEDCECGEAKPKLNLTCSREGSGGTLQSLQCTEIQLDFTEAANISGRFLSSFTSS